MIFHVIILSIFYYRKNVPRKPWQTDALCWLQSGGDVEVVAIELRRLRCSDFEKKPMGVFLERSLWFVHFLAY